MWHVSGKTIGVGLFQPFKPLEVLYDFDGPRTFTHFDHDGQLCLAHWCDEDGETTRFLVVPFSEHLVQQLKDGELTLRDALDQPRIWLLDIAHSGEPLAAWIVHLADLPSDVLPLPGTMLLPTLEPLLSLRAVGEDIQEGRVPGSVIRGLVEGAQKAIKMLAEYVLDQPIQTGRPPALIKRLFDLPAQRLAFGSFEIAFRSPLSGSAILFDDLTAEDIRQEKEALQRVGDLLQIGLTWLSSTEANRASGAVGQNPDESRLILQAVKSITPSSQGPVREVEVRGTLIKNPVRPVRLNRDSRRSVNTALARTPGRESIVQLSGHIREVDLDRLTFDLREINSEVESRKFAFDEDLIEDVLQALQEDSSVTVAGVDYPTRKLVQALAIGRS
jgi:hypothetical protein